MGMGIIPISIPIYVVLIPIPTPVDYKIFLSHSQGNPVNPIVVHISSIE